MQNFLNRIIKVVTIGSLVSTVLMQVLPASATTLAFTTVSDIQSRLKAGAITADHNIHFTLPGSVDFDNTGSTDVLTIRYNGAFGANSATWLSTDFTFSDGGTAHPVWTTVVQGSGPQIPDCSGAPDQDVAVAVETDQTAFFIVPCGVFTSPPGATMHFTINGTTGGGRFFNPSTPNPYPVVITQTDEGTVGAVSSTIQTEIVDDDQVTLSATVDPSITFDLDTPASGATCTPTSAPYAIPFGTLTSASVFTSGTGGNAVPRLCLNLATNATGGVNVTVLSANGALKSTSHPTDTIPSSTATEAAGTANYGICVGVAATGLTAASPFNGSCAVNAANHVGAVTTSIQNLLTSSGPVADGISEVYASAAISAATPAHNDYADTLTFIATATF